MTYDPNYTRTTPLRADRWNCTCEQPEGHQVCPTHGKWPNRHTELQEDRYTAWDRVRELQETCRVLTELAQQLTDAAHHVLSIDGELVILREAIDAAAVLGITPQQQP